MTLGTASYMSPEQAAGDTLDGRSDLFSLGIVLYECATGRRPFVATARARFCPRFSTRAPMEPGLLNPDLPLRLQQVITDCLEKDPDLRYQNAASLRADLKRVKRDLESGRIGSVDGGQRSADDRWTQPATGVGNHRRYRSLDAGVQPPETRPPMPTPPPPARRLCAASDRCCPGSWRDRCGCGWIFSAARSVGRSRPDGGAFLVRGFRAVAVRISGAEPAGKAVP